jgi:alpha-tubulin suppressor-like RCC1 family protein
MANRSEPIPVTVPGAVELGVGYEHTCARSSGGDVWCWGSFTGWDAASAALLDDPVPHVVPGIVDPIAIEGGNESTCAIEDGGRIVCWGQNESGRLGDGLVADRGLPPAPIAEPIVARTLGRFGAGLLALDVSGAVWGWGSNTFSQLARTGIANSPRPVTLPGLEGATFAAGGREHGCALGDPWVRCWGSDEFGQLGRGIVVPGVHAAPGDVIGLPAGIVELAVGSYHACVRTATDVWCWGKNGRGQLGDGTFADSPDAVRLALPGAAR